MRGGGWLTTGASDPRQCPGDKQSARVILKLWVKLSNRNYNFQRRQQSLTMSKLLDTTSSIRDQRPLQCCKWLHIVRAEFYHAAAAEFGSLSAVWPPLSLQYAGLHSLAWLVPWLQPVNDHTVHRDWLQPVQCTKGSISEIQGKQTMFVSFHLILFCVSVISPVISEF